MSFYCAYHEVTVVMLFTKNQFFEKICSVIPPNAIIINEGATTMDIGRTVLFNELPRHR